jgi:AMP-binding enzyme
MPAVSVGRSAGRGRADRGARHRNPEPLPPGEPGEIWVRGLNVMLGYWNLPDTPDGWYRTGDVAYADDHGYLFIVDRVKDMIVSGGETSIRRKSSSPSMSIRTYPKWQSSVRRTRGGPSVCTRWSFPSQARS